ncbi:MAG: recombinase family protein, partial [Burkholderiales bacterium]|nr:recombinase family protein [Burkholderiales bacterium]
MKVVVYSIHRLVRDLKDIISTLNNKGVAISLLSGKLTFSSETDDAFAKLRPQMMEAFAEFERN